MLFEQSNNCLKRYYPLPHTYLSRRSCLIVVISESYIDLTTFQIVCDGRQSNSFTFVNISLKFQGTYRFQIAFIWNDLDVSKSQNMRIETFSKAIINVCLLLNKSVILAVIQTDKEFLSIRSSFGYLVCTYCSSAIQSINIYSSCIVIEKLLDEEERQGTHNLNIFLRPNSF